MGSMVGYRALVVHLQPEALGELVEVLSEPGLAVDTARSSTEALHKISAIDYAVIIADHKPPELDGYAFLGRAATFCPDAMRIVLLPDLEAMEAPDGRQTGTIFRFFAKPHERRQLLAVVAEGLKLHRLEREQRELIKRLQVEQQRLQRREKLLDAVVKERTRGLELSLARLKAANRQALLGLAEAIEAKDKHTRGHCSRVAGYAVALGRETGLGGDDLETLEFAAVLHDIGKIGVPDSVLLKEGPLDDHEWTLMRAHPVIGCDIASRIEMLQPAVPCIRNHHERWDGKGYPDGLAGESIPLLARIVSVCDACDAMGTERPYKRALPVPECERLLQRNAGVMFDPRLVEVFVHRHLATIFRESPAALPAAAEAAHDR